jgi:hypothetical protein
MLAARVEQKNGTYVHNIQTDIQSSPHPTGVAMFGINPDRRSQQQAAIAVLNVGGVDDGVQQQTECIDQNMPLLALVQLAGIEAIRIDAGPLFLRSSRSDCR